MAQNQELSELGQYLNVNTASGVVSTNAYAGSFMGPKAFSVLSPVANDAYVILWTNAALTLTEIKTVVSGTTPSVTATFAYGTGAFAAGNTVIQSSIVTTNVTSGNDQTSFANASIPANSYIWCYVNAVSGTVTYYHTTLRFA